MLSFVTCMRKHFWQYEVGLRRIETGLALRFGSAFHRAMEARWQGKSYEESLLAATSGDIDELSTFTVGALLAGYYERYGTVETGKMLPEKKFYSEIEAGFQAAGIIDCLGEIDGRSAVIEHKTTSDSVSDDSDYWLRLSFNMQILNYVIEARKLGFLPEVIFYDVIRKPSISQKMIDDRDADGLKIVNDTSGKRAIKKDGKPRLTGGDGFTVQQHLETPAEFGDRLYQDTLARPDFYFARREVPILSSQLQQFYNQRSAIISLIVSARNREFEQHDCEAWPRNVSEHTCNFCEYKGFCLQGIEVDLSNPPSGFEISTPSPELTKI